MTTTQESTDLSALQVAKYIIASFHEKEIDEGMAEGISNLKLQKLLSFCQAYFLALKDRPMFRENIYAWKYGPVVNEVYQEYAEHGNKPIPKTQKPKLSEEIRTMIDAVLKTFGGYSAIRLMEITHSHKPWKDLEKQVLSGERDIIIQHKALKEYYTPMLRT